MSIISKKYDSKFSRKPWKANVNYAKMYPCEQYTKKHFIPQIKNAKYV